MKSSSKKPLILELNAVESAAINGGRRGRGADDPPGHGRGHGADDPPGHQ